VRRPAGGYIEHSMLKLQSAACDSYFRQLYQTINTLFTVVNFLKCVVTEV